jgi:hypothetical protein
MPGMKARVSVANTGHAKTGTIMSHASQSRIEGQRFFVNGRCVEVAHRVRVDEVAADDTKQMCQFVGTQSKRIFPTRVTRGLISNSRGIVG